VITSLIVDNRDLSAKILLRIKQELNMTNYRIVYTDDIPVGITTDEKGILTFSQPKRHPGYFAQYKKEVLELNQRAELILAVLQGVPASE